MDLKEILDQYGIRASDFSVHRIGSGHINETYRLEGEQTYILQKINDKVFTRPELIEGNLRYAETFLTKNYPEYLFIAPIHALSRGAMVRDKAGNPWRLYPFMPNTHTIDRATDERQAFRAAAAFAELGKLLSTAEPSHFSATIDRFHDLSLRYEQFQQALAVAAPERRTQAAGAIASAQRHGVLVTQYRQHIERGVLRVGIFHNDTKINNVLFNELNDEAVAVIDLDTLMPGYYIYDVGDLVRTLVCPVTEEEMDVTRIHVRPGFYEAVIDGYMSEMKDTLSLHEQKLIHFSGPMMTYIMAIRFLADFLRGDTYYHTTYPGQNLVRSTNQLKLLDELSDFVRPNV